MTNNYKRIILKKGREDSLIRQHPWVFSGAVDQRDDTILNGEIVQVLSDNGKFLAIGHYQHTSIEVRILSFKQEEIDSLFWENRLTQILDVRQFVSSDLNAIYRLVNSEGDNLSGLVIDIYGTTAVIQCTSLGMHLARKTICEALLKLMKKSGVQNVMYKPDASLANIGNQEIYSECLAGENSHILSVENGLKFNIDWDRGQKTGFFINQRDNRALFEKYAGDRNVLDLFSYTASFSLYAMRGDAKSIHFVDRSSRYVSMAMGNLKLNFPDDSRYEGFSDDAFKYLEQSEQGIYDLMVLDPPPFATHRGAIKNALKGYKRLNALAMEKVAKGGIIFTFSNSQIISREAFQTSIFSAAMEASRNVRILHYLSHASDHPISIYHPEGESLNGLVLYVE